MFVLVNSGSLPAGVSLALRGLACLAFAGVVAAVVAGGVLPGALLLGFGLWGSTRRPAATVPR